MTKNRAFCQLDSDCIDWIADGCFERMWANKSRLDYDKIAPTFPVGRTVSGVYCIWQNRGGRAQPLYIGESDNLRRRIRQLRILTKHAFARQFANYNARKNRLRRPTKEVAGKLSFKRRLEIEEGLEERYAKQLRLGWVETTFGRKEIEESLRRRFNPPFND